MSLLRIDGHIIWWRGLLDKSWFHPAAPPKFGRSDGIGGTCALIAHFPPNASNAELSISRVTDLASVCHHHDHRRHVYLGILLGAKRIEELEVFQASV
jgi:hypothetical protein